MSELLISYQRRGKGLSVLVKTVRRSLENTGVKLQNKRLVVGVSGGPDSLALLHSLKRLQADFKYQIWVAHLDHGLRRESKADALFVQKISEELDVPCIVEKREVTKNKPKHVSQELQARRIRHIFLREVANSLGAVAVALGHTSDDQSETVLLHILRGSGMAGIAGMRSVISWPEPKIDTTLLLLRPLLSISHNEALSYCESVGLKPRLDASNYDLRYTRNRIRHHLIPELELYNPQIRQALWRLARNVNADIEFLKAEATKHLDQILQPTKEGIKLSIKSLNELPLALQRHVLRLAYAKVNGSADGISQKHLESMLSLFSKSKAGHLNLPNDIHIRATMSTVTLSHGQIATQPSLVKNKNLMIPGTTSFGNWKIKATLLPKPVHPVENPQLAYLDKEAVGKQIIVRARRPGDRFQPLGMNFYKKLQDFFVDEKIPQEMRDQIPIIEGDRGILWVVGERIAHWARATSKSQSLLVLEAESSTKYDA